MSLRLAVILFIAFSLTFYSVYHNERKNNTSQIPLLTTNTLTSLAFKIKKIGVFDHNSHCFSKIEIFQISNINIWFITVGDFIPPSCRNMQNSTNANTICNKLICTDFSVKVVDKKNRLCHS